MSDPEEPQLSSELTGGRAAAERSCERVGEPDRCCGQQLCQQAAAACWGAGQQQPRHAASLQCAAHLLALGCRGEVSRGGERVCAKVSVQT